VFRFQHDENGVNNNAYATEAAGTKPENAGPNFAFVKTMQAQVAQQYAKGQGNPFVVFALCGHKNSLVLGSPNIENSGAAKFF
jgi:hypothetical protein